MTEKRLKLSQKKLDAGAIYIANGYQLQLTNEGYTITKKKALIFQCSSYRLARQTFGHCIK